MGTILSHLKNRKIGIPPDPHSKRGRPPTVPTPSPVCGKGRAGLATQTLVAVNFSSLVAPLTDGLTCVARSINEPRRWDDDDDEDDDDAAIISSCHQL